MSSSEDEMDIIPDPDIHEVETLDEHLLPPKSKERYLKAYDNFVNWRKGQQDTSFSENVFLTYFNEMSKKLEPPTLWGIFSMLKSTVIKKHDVNIRDYKRLTTLLKRLSLGYKSKKSKVFTSHHVTTFLNEAPDDRYLATKVSLIFGVSGGCKGNELANLTVDDVELHNKLLLIKLRDTRTMIERTFIVRGEYIDLIQKYQALRPSNVDTNRFFLNFQRGKCSKQVIGKNKFANMPKEIATYLKLPNPEHYTGRCFRRTSSMLADCDLTALKRHAASGPHQVPERCMDDSADNDSTITIPFTEAIYFRPNANPPRPPTSRACVPILSLDSLSEPKQEPISAPQSPREYQELQDTRHGRESQHRPTTQPNQTNINIPDKTIAFTFKNCTNVTKYQETFARGESQGQPTSQVNEAKMPQLSQTNLNMPGKTISMTFKNCSNFTINF